MKRNPAGTAVTIGLSIVAVLYLYPLVLVFINSFKSFAEITTNVVALPSALSLANFKNAFTLMEYPRLFLNTLFVTAIGTAGVVLVSSAAGYRLSRTKTRYSWLVFLLCIAPMMIPFHSFMIALVKVARNLHLTGSTYGWQSSIGGLGRPFPFSCIMGS